MQKEPWLCLAKPKKHQANNKALRKYPVLVTWLSTCQYTCHMIVLSFILSVCLVFKVPSTCHMIVYLSIHLSHDSLVFHLICVSCISHKPLWWLNVNTYRWMHANIQATALLTYPRSICQRHTQKASSRQGLLTITKTSRFLKRFNIVYKTVSSTEILVIIAWTMDTRGMM